ncbi:MAG TPA: filamentous hemagglutinin N-terminal domain-containing protein, partial [Stellaceae bacterium]|nr:filamentous hemagglutinin N-terminal domain-containing protein [Stellaceae bacterium]
MFPRPPGLTVLLPLALLLASGISRAQSILPSGGHTVAGTATVGVPAGNTLSITQTSPKAIVNWNTFSVGQPNTVQFNQPGSSAAILNRVTGAASSTIAGQIDGNGQVYLVNPNGIAITSTGSVQVGGGFVASTLGISNRNFMSGNLSFTGNGASAGVSNAGTISTGPGGYAALIGGTAANSGVISVPLGKVALGSGEAATLDLNGDGFMQVAVPTGATTAKGQALVSNSGRINASGGSVELRAATVATAIRDAVNMSGVIAANSVSGHDGAITLSGGPGGAVNVAGTLDASAAPASGAAGGAVQVSGARVRLGHHAVVNASGAQGGSVLVGVTAPGGVGAAQSTTIASGAQILAAGDPSVAGSGGYVETSGGTLQFGGATIDPGKGGTWLADPTNLTIDAAAATTISNTLNLGGDVFEETAGDGTTSGSGNTSSGAGDIIVDAAISWNTTNTLTLSAFNGITVNAPITISGAGNLVLTTNNNIGGTSTGNGVLTFTPTLGSLQFTAPEGSGQTLTINTLSYTLLYNVGEVQNINGNLSGNYALAIPLNAATDPTAPANWSPIGESTPFTGNFNGMGNTIANLTINDTTDDFVGLFGQLGSGSPNSGTISNLGLVGGSVTGSGSFVFVGELVGLNNFGGTISNSYATGAVSGSGSGSGILTEVGTGGLVGLNYGTITASYATGAVSGSGYTADVGGLVGYSSAGAIGNSYATGAVSGSGSFPFVGGLVGLNFGTTVTDAYAAGAVTVGSGTNSAAGGLVGVNDGTITDAYATGAVSGGTGAALGGLVGSGRGAADGYYDAGTTGMPYDGVVGLTTAQLQSTPGVAGAFNLSTGFANPGNWGIIPGVSYPYLTAFYPSTPQVISGIAYQDAGVTPLASSSGNYSGAIPANGTVSALVGGTNLGAVTTGANGYYYFLEPAGTVPSTPPGGGVLTYSPGAGASGGAAFADGITGGNATGLTIFGNTLHEITPDTANSTLQANLALALGSDPTATPLLAGLPNLQIDASGASFDIDSGILYPLGNVTLNVNALTESAGAITASGLAVNSIGSVDLPINNLVTTLAANVTGLGSTFDFSDAQTLTVGTVGSVSGVTTNGTDGSAANIVLATTSGDIDIEQPVSTNGSNGPVLGASLGEIGLDAAGNIVMNQSGSAGQLIAFGVEAFASGNIDLDGSANFFGNRIGGSDNIYGEAQTAGFFAGETTAAGDPLTFTDSNAGLTIGQLGVSAGSITLSAISGVYSNGGDIQIASLYPLFPFSGGLST